MRNNNLALSQELEYSRAPALLAARRALVADDDEGVAESAARHRMQQQQMAERTFWDELGAPLLEDDDQRYFWKDAKREAGRARRAAARARRRARWTARLESLRWWAEPLLAMVVAAWAAARFK